MAGDTRICRKILKIAMSSHATSTWSMKKQRLILSFVFRQRWKENNYLRVNGNLSMKESDFCRIKTKSLHSKQRKKFHSNKQKKNRPGKFRPISARQHFSAAQSEKTEHGATVCNVWRERSERRRRVDCGGFGTGGTCA